MPQGSFKFKNKPTGKVSKANVSHSRKSSEHMLKKGKVQIAPKKQKLIEKQSIEAVVKNMINKKVDAEIMTKAKDEKLNVVKGTALQSKKPQNPKK